MIRYVCALALAALIATPALAQDSQVVLDVTADRDQGGSSLGTGWVFRVDNTGGLVTRSVLGVGTIPMEGAGDRLMWHPYKAAFRAGSIGSGGDYWNESNVGFYTWAGGYNTQATGLAAFAMGYQSQATGSYSVALGYYGHATGTGSIAMGYRSNAQSSYGVAIGQRATTAGYTGAIVFSDASTTDSTQATANNQFMVRASGGYRLFTNSSRTTGVQLAASGSSWSVVSDRNAKEDFVDIDAEAVLQRMAQLPLSTYHYIDGEAGVRHVGPMAQDWQRLVSGPLGLNADSTVINQGDFDGINLAGVVALEARTRQQAERIAALEGEVAALRAALVAERSEGTGLRQTVAAQASRLDALDARLGAVLAALDVAPAEPLASAETD